MTTFKNRTDLTLEAQEMLIRGEPNKKDFDGIVSHVRKEGKLNITHVEITNNAGAEKIGKPIGNYITIEVGNSELKNNEDYVHARSALATELKNIIPDMENKTILIIGLGNWNVTPDALGPKVVSKLAITRHILEYFPDEREKNLNPVCALAPGVLGITGIETAEIIKGVADHVKPDIIIAIDALASMRTDRVNKTVQLCDTGIAPGSGVGNKRKELSKQTLGVPVYAIGVPTVVDAITMANETIDSMIREFKKENESSGNIYTFIKDIDPQDKQELISKVFQPGDDNMIVTPRGIDEAITVMSKLIADSLNVMIHHKNYNYLQQTYLM
ncbi:MAG TPA: GPR endopeptidase [Clostridiales bacterium]|nr:GPR endopeptidase [Clostridiales bacterium]